MKKVSAIVMGALMIGVVVFLFAGCADLVRRQNEGESAARVAEAQAQVAQAHAQEAGYRMEREMNQDDNEYDILKIVVSASSREMEKNGDVIRYLATAEQRRKDQREVFVQLIILAVAGAGTFVWVEGARRGRWETMDAKVGEG